MASRMEGGGKVTDKTDRQKGRVWVLGKKKKRKEEDRRRNREGGRTEAMPEWDSVRQQKKRILFETPHLHSCYKSKDVEHFCLSGGRHREGKREEEGGEGETRSERIESR